MLISFFFVCDWVFARSGGLVECGMRMHVAGKGGLGEKRREGKRREYETNWYPFKKIV